MTSVVSVSSGVVLACSAIIGMRLALPLHTLQPYTLICRYMAPLTPRVPPLFALDRRLIVSSAALLTSLILVNRATLVQARLLPAILSVVTLSMALAQVQSGGLAILRCPLARLLALFTAVLSLLLSLCRQVAVSICRREAKHRIVAPLLVPLLAVPPLALMLTTRRLMHA